MRLLIGGSPCTYWSIAQTKNRETEASGMGWQLFCNYAIARDKFQPDYFLYENNKSMAIPIREQITQILGVEPVCINSALVSAQNRQRLYWVGRRRPDGTYEQVPVEQPEDKGVPLRDVLETTVAEKGYTLAEPICVAQRGRYTGESGSVEQHFEVQESGKTNTLTTVQKDNLVAEPIRIGTMRVPEATKQGYTDIAPGECVDLAMEHSKTRRGRRMAEKSNCLTTSCAFYEYCGTLDYPIYKVENGKISIKGKQYPIKLRDGCYIIRKLTVLECMRLQTVPEWYVFPVSDSQAYKMLGNGWTVDVITHIMSHFEGITEEPLDVLSMYDGMCCGMLALRKLGITPREYWASEIDKYCIKTVEHNFQNVKHIGDAFAVRDDNWRWGEDG